MKVLLYFEGIKILKQSGIGRAREHQMRALQLLGYEITEDPKCTDYDILHINTYALKSLLLAHKAKRLGKKIVYHAHSTEEDFRNSFIGANLVSGLFKRHLIHLYNLADIVITPTEYSKHLLEGYGIKPPIVAISNGIDLARYQRSEKKEQAFRKYFNLSENQKVIISAGLFIERKGILDFVKIAESFPEITFIWFGHAPLYTIPRKIRHVVQKAHPENVIFPGYIRGDVYEGAYTSANLFFFPSYEETEGIVVLEALASHQLVLVRDIPVYHPWLSDGQNALMGNTNTEFAQKIEMACHSDCSSIINAGEDITQQRTIEAVSQQLKTVYESLIKEV
ncbi:MAG: glycosyltransferase [Streptococcaceae bacterium]|nr:glycosyltransferase [Streptococcaceae bacterium]MCH4178180.1 glycosyltransferase [Streptococcaceae bacterium]